MEIITNSFKEVLDLNTPSYTKKIVLNTRGFEGGAEVYGPGVDITPLLLEITPVKWKLDTEGYGVWNASTTTLTLDNTGGSFDGEQLFHKSKITVHAGVVNAARFKETLAVFEGYVLTDPVYNLEEKTVAVTITSRLSTLDEISAEGICLCADEQELVRVDDKTFRTQNTCVREIKSVTLGERELRAGIDYDARELNVYKTPAQIVLKEASAPEDVLRAGYVYNYEDKQIEWLVNEVADKACVGARHIDKADFGQRIINTFEENSSSGFNGVFEGVEFVDNKIRPLALFPDEINVAWTSMALPTGVSWEFKPDGVLLLGGANISGVASASAEQRDAYGTWRFRVPILNINGSDIMIYHFISSSSYYTNSNGYAFEIRKTRLNPMQDAIYLILYKVNSGVNNIIITQQRNLVPTPTEIEVIISRNYDGVFKFWFRSSAPSVSQWIELNMGTDNTYTTSAYQLANLQGGGNYITNIRHSPFAAVNAGDVGPQGEYTTPAIDGGEHISQWRSCLVAEMLPQGTSSSLFFRHKSNEDAVWSPWQSVTPGALAACAERYIQLKWTVFPNGAELPYLSGITVSWETLSANISVLNTKGLSCLDCLKELALMTTYEIGFDRRGKFLFRKRNVDTGSFYTLGPADICEMESVCAGADGVYNNIRVAYGAYVTAVSPAAEGEASPHSEDKYGARSYDVSSGAFLPVASADITLPLAKTLYLYLKDAKKRVVVITKFLPQIELGDIVKLGYQMSGLPLEAPGIAKNIFLRVEGIELDLENWQTRLDLSEVL